MSATNGPFVGFDVPALRKLAPHGTVRTFPKLSVVVNEGDDTDSLYVLLSGRVKVFITGEDGREAVVNTVEVGDSFGERVRDGQLVVIERLTQREIAARIGGSRTQS